MASLEAALITGLNADTDMQTTVSGGWYYRRVPEDAARPYGWVVRLSSEPSYLTGSQYTEQMVFQLTVVGSTDTQVESARDDLMEYINARNFSLTFDEGTLIDHSVGNKEFDWEEENPAIWSFQAELTLLIQKTRPA